MNDGKKTAVRESKFNFDGTESEVVENKVQWCANQSTVVVEGNWTKRKLMSHH